MMREMYSAPRVINWWIHVELSPLHVCAANAQLSVICRQCCRLLFVLCSVYFTVTSHYSCSACSTFSADSPLCFIMMPPRALCGRIQTDISSTLKRNTGSSLISARPVHWCSRGAFAEGSGSKMNSSLFIRFNFWFCIVQHMAMQWSTTCKLQVECLVACSNFTAYQTNTKAKK